MFPLASLAVYTIVVVSLKTCGGLIPDGEIVICGARLLLSRAIGLVQLTNAVAFMFILARISEGHLIKTGGVTSVGEYKEENLLLQTSSKAQHCRYQVAHRQM